MVLVFFLIIFKNVYYFNIIFYNSEQIDAARLFVAAIDFGTTYSGYAYSTKSDPSAIETCKWKYGQLESSKALTSVLLDRKKNFLAFGYEAEKKFVDNAGDDKPDVLYYFRRFKMILHNQVCLIRSIWILHLTISSPTHQAYTQIVHCTGNIVSFDFRNYFYYV